MTTNHPKAQFQQHSAEKMPFNACHALLQGNS